MASAPLNEELCPLVLPPPAMAAANDVAPVAKRRCLLKEMSMPASPSLMPLGMPSPATTSAGGSDVEALAEKWTLDMPGVDEPRRFAVEQLRAYLNEYASADVDPFWQRKSQKAVLAVVVCRSQTGNLTAYRGMNTEVSLPAGSFCAERAAIAQSASAFQRASEIVAVAVVDPDDKLNPLWPCEVCQSWLSKLRLQSPSIAVIAVTAAACDGFLVRVNGELQTPPSPMRTPSPPPSPPRSTCWSERVQVTDGNTEWPWEAQKLVYVDGAWSYLHSGHQNILRIARSCGTHLLVGIHSDEVLKEEFGSVLLEDFETRLGRLRQNRYVDSVLLDAPWNLTQDLIASLGISQVVTGSIEKTQDICKRRCGCDCEDPYRIARELGILTTVPSADETTEWEVRERSAMFGVRRS